MAQCTKRWVLLSFMTAWGSALGFGCASGGGADAPTKAGSEAMEPASEDPSEPSDTSDTGTSGPSTARKDAGADARKDGGASTTTPRKDGGSTSQRDATAPDSGSSGDDNSGRLAPSVRNPKYQSVAPPLGEVLPAAEPGTWAYIDVDGAKSRDGSPAGFYYKHSKTGDKNLLIYLVGGGACQDTFFCNMNPPNKDFSLTAESIGSGVFNVLGPTAEAQDPKLERWNSGLFKDDPANPVKDWNMVFVPYVTGDVFSGANPNGQVPGVAGTHQFVGRANMLKFLARIVPTFKDAQTVLLTGSSAGGLGALLTAPFLVDAYIDLGHGARVFVVDDAGPFFDDQYLEVCLQQRYRDLFGLNDSFPKDCANCSGQGGGIAASYLAYLVDKFPDNLLGGLIDSDNDEIMSFFFSEGLENCSFIDNPLVGVLLYPQGRYRDGLKNLLDVHMKRMSSYVWSGALHQNFFKTDSGDRFYQMNGLKETPAQWLANLLSGKMERVGL